MSQASQRSQRSQVSQRSQESQRSQASQRSQVSQKSQASKMCLTELWDAWDSWDLRDLWNTWDLWDPWDLWDYQGILAAQKTSEIKAVHWPCMHVWVNKSMDRDDWNLTTWHEMHPTENMTSNFVNINRRTTVENGTIMLLTGGVPHYGYQIIKWSCFWCLNTRTSLSNSCFNAFITPGLHSLPDCCLICLICDRINPYLFLDFNPPLYVNQP